MTPYRILHISDIHFGSSFSSPLWQYVKTVASKTSPRLIACTGDMVDHGGIFKLATARRELEALAREVGMTCLVRAVPGNHDVAIFGNLRLWPTIRTFDPIFGHNAIELPKGVPSYQTYRQSGPLRRAWQWTKYTTMLYWRSIPYWWRLRGNPPPVVRDDDPDEVFLAYLDSNEEQAAATGRVGGQSLSDLQIAMTNLSTDMNKFFVPRILLLHHHPAPIAYSDVSESLTSFEPFLMLRNAGTVVRELAKHDFDLALHGHKHFSGFCRLGFGLIGGGEREVAVLAAGSCGVPEAGAGRNGVNIIDVYSNGQVRFNQLAFGSGQSLAISELEKNGNLVHSIDVQKDRCFQRAVLKVHQRCESLERHLEIDKQGAAHIRYRCEKLRVTEGELAKQKTIRLQVSVGCIHPAGIDLDAPSLAAGYSLVPRTAHADRCAICDIDFGENISKDSNDISFGYGYTTLGTFALTGWEAQELHKRALCMSQPEINPPGRNCFNLVVRTPTERAKLTLSLPRSLVSPQVKVRVLRANSFPGSLLSREDEFDVHHEKWDLDPVMTQHEEQNLRQLELQKWSLELYRPLPGYRYELSWMVNSSEESFSPIVAAQALAHRKRLLSAGNDGYKRDQMSAHLTDIACYLADEFEVKEEDGERLAVALFVYDGDKQGLELVAEGVSDGNTPNRPLHFPLGVGIPGISFKRRRPTSFVSPLITGASSDAMYVANAPAEGVTHAMEYNVIVAVPIHPPLSPTVNANSENDRLIRSPRETIGVMTVATTAYDSKLTEMVLTSKELRGPPEDSDGSTMLRDLWALLDVTNDALLDIQRGT